VFDQIRGVHPGLDLHLDERQVQRADELLLGHLSEEVHAEGLRAFLPRAAGRVQQVAPELLAGGAAGDGLQAAGIPQAAEGHGDPDADSPDQTDDGGSDSDDGGSPLTPTSADGGNGGGEPIVRPWLLLPVPSRLAPTLRADRPEGCYRATPLRALL